jgi:hypothetical protein
MLVRERILTLVDRYSVVLVAMVLALVFVLFPRVIFVFDSQYYMGIAAGDLEATHAPFSSRALVPLIVAAVHDTTGLSLEHGFMAVAIVSAAAFAFSIRTIARIEGYTPLPILIYAATTIFAMQTFAVAAMPDAAFAAVIALCFAALRAGQLLAAALLSALVVAVRDSGVIFLLFVLWYLVSLRQWRPAILTAVLGLAAWRLITLFADAGLGNVHEMNAALYMLLKVPVNFLIEVMGIPLWTDSIAWCSPPTLAYPIPPFLPTGRMHQVGICGWDPARPIRNLATLLTVFGTLPALLIAAKGAKSERANDRWLVLAGGYGVLMVALGLCTGASVARLISYGWPLLVLALPALWQRRSRGELPLRLLPWHLLALGVCLAARLVDDALAVPAELAALAAALLCQIAVFFLARRAFRAA